MSKTLVLVESNLLDCGVVVSKSFAVRASDGTERYVQPYSDKQADEWMESTAARYRKLGFDVAMSDWESNAPDEESEVYSISRTLTCSK